MIYLNRENGPAASEPTQTTSSATFVDLCPSPEAKERQRYLMLEAMRAGPLTSVQARERLGILHPPGRVFELRRLGYEIDTVPTLAVDADGRQHRCARYVLGGRGAK